MDTTKKLLCGVDLPDGSCNPAGFLIPWRDNDRWILLGLGNRSQCSTGLLVYTGRPVSVNDVFAKVVDATLKIESVDELMAALRAYIEALEAFKIGDVLSIGPTDSPPGFCFLKDGWPDSTSCSCGGR
jgi:hypothetical protein